MSSANDIIHTLALCHTQGLGNGRIRRLIEYFGSASEVFAQTDTLSRSPYNLPISIVRQLQNKTSLIAEAEREWNFIERNGIACLLPGDENFPHRLSDCPDAPLLLFHKGNTAFNIPRTVGIVGTRRSTPYGEEACRRFLHELSELCPDTLIVSGLAYGIDISAHRAALQNGMLTVGVLAHGLDRIYPHSHRETARCMLEQGGLLTEFSSGTIPDKQNFVLRNRIVAGISDAIIVIESAEKGGALITAEIAGSYNRDCFAFPGRITDAMSAGCHRLIADNKAALLYSAEEFVKSMCWNEATKTKPTAVQRQLFPELNETEQHIVQLLRNSEAGKSMNELVVESKLSVSQLTSVLFGLEMQGIIKQSAGNLYRLLL